MICALIAAAHYRLVPNVARAGYENGVFLVALVSSSPIGKWKT